MASYKVCNPRTGVDIGTFEADSAAAAISQAGGGCHLVATAVGLPAAPADNAPPFNLPLTVGTQHGRVSDQIFDARGQAVLILYGVDSRGSLEEARTMNHNKTGLARGDYVVKAVNEHEGLVKRVAELERQLREASSMLKTVSQCASHECEDCREHAGLHHNAIETLIGKPVDRRKD